MRIRGSWPFHPDRPISLPINWQSWIATAHDDDDNDEKHDNPDATAGDSHPSAMMQMSPPIFTLKSSPGNQHPNVDHSFPVNATQQQSRTFNPTNPFANPAFWQGWVFWRACHMAPGLLNFSGTFSITEFTRISLAEDLSHFECPTSNPS
ncbi:hypothetical protein PILCRDRAFT_781 [Piloderma croceum F 1598]|uniref:Uncharacterized protein n=1 Tax=Piloderma croceum (strain F 1598) TaxID=765440 RepID=A0A0C3CPQ8_PILCF|nr:hypothetical protein PILCRDRAFT_781 [Piloderma croceum F 1598]